MAETKALVGVLRPSGFEAVLGHRELLETILDGDPDRAEETMRRHVLDFEESMRRILTGA